MKYKHLFKKAHLFLTALFLPLLFTPIVAHAFPAIDASPYTLPCNYDTNFTGTAKQQWLTNVINASGAGVTTGHATSGGYQSTQYQAVLYKATGATYYTLALAYGGTANLRIVVNTAGTTTVKAAAEPITGNFTTGAFHYYNWAYSGSTTTGWQQVAASTWNSSDVGEICGYTDNVGFERATGTYQNATYRKYFPFADRSYGLVGPQWHFMDTYTTEPTVTTSTGSTGLTQSQMESTLVEFSALWMALVVAGYVVYSWRFR